MKQVYSFGLLVLNLVSIVQPVEEENMKKTQGHPKLSPGGSEGFHKPLDGSGGSHKPPMIQRPTILSIESPYLASN